MGTSKIFLRNIKTNQFKRKGVHRRGKWNNFDREKSLGNSFSVDTVYSILYPSRKIGGVIGKAGSIVEALREETQAKTTVADSVPGSDERVITIYSSPEKILRNQNNDEDSTTGNEQETVEHLCASQDALLKVHERIVEEGLSGWMAPDYDNENIVVTARLLVPNNMVGCLLGKRGDVIQRLQSETGASIRVLPADHLPSCAMSTDELVQAWFGFNFCCRHPLEAYNNFSERKIRNAQQVAYYQRGLNHKIRCMIGVAAIFTLADPLRWRKEQKNVLNGSLDIS